MSRTEINISPQATDAVLETIFSQSDCNGHKAVSVSLMAAATVLYAFHAGDRLQALVQFNSVFDQAWEHLKKHGCPIHAETVPQSEEA